MQDRTPLIDPSTFEMLVEVYRIVERADNDNTPVDPGDIAFINGLLRGIIKANSIPKDDPRIGFTLTDRIKSVADKFKV